jgi:hypothetical protein
MGIKKQKMEEEYFTAKSKKLKKLKKKGIKPFFDFFDFAVNLLFQYCREAGDA